MRPSPHVCHRCGTFELSIDLCRARRGILNGPCARPSRVGRWSYCCCWLGAGDCHAARGHSGARAGCREIEDVEDSLVRDPRTRCGSDAALILGRLRQQRSVPALITALRDPASGGARQRGARARADRRAGRAGRRRRRASRSGARSCVTWRACAAATGPSVDVRRRAAGRARASARRPGGRPPLSFEVKPVGDPDTAGRPGAAQPHARLPGRAAAAASATSRSRTGQATYAVDGVIKTPVRRSRGPRRRGQLRGPAGRQPPARRRRVPDDLRRGDACRSRRRQWRPQLRASMELEALEAAVRGASEDLVTQLRVSR